MKKWWGKRTRTEKWMIAIIALLIICIATRWGWIKSEVGGAVGAMFEK